MGIIDNILGRINDDKPKQETFTGRIIHLDNSYGFLSSHDIPFERIFFHWSGLVQDTLKFPDLEVGMIVDFVGKDNGPDKGWQAIKIKVKE